MGRRGRPGSPPLVMLGGGADDTDGEALEGREGGCRDGGGGGGAGGFLPHNKRP